MKTVKPLSLSTLQRVVEHGGRFHFTVTALMLVPLDGPGAPLLEMELWKTVAKELGEGVALDEAMPKARGEVLVTGSAYVPGGASAPACEVRVAIGTVDKYLRVIGDRVWDERGGTTNPAPFTSMPLTWARSFGGEGYPENPTGKGFAVVQTPAGPVRPLPNIEDPRALVRTPDDHPPPAGLGAYDFSWPQRASKLGTYDAQWLANDFPGFARDVDWTAFNAAPSDQWTDGAFRGDEAFALVNLHPERPRIEGSLPGLLARAFVNRRVEGAERFEEVPLRLETVHFLPGALRAVLLFRGVTIIEEDDADDVLHLLLACERLGEPKPEEHYRHVLARRTHPQHGARHALREGDLLPAGVVSGFKSLVPEDPSPHQGLLQANLRRKAEAQLATTRAMFAAHGIDPDQHLPRAVPTPEPEGDPEDLPAAIERATASSEEHRAEALAARARAEANARSMCAAQGIDFDALLAAAPKQGGGPPKPIFPFRPGEASLVDPALLAKVAEAEAQLLAAYKKTAHHRPAAAHMDGELAAVVRSRAQEYVAAGQSLATYDLTGADLSNLHLPGADFREALMESVRLSGSQLAGSSFAGAVLVRADLARASLAGVSFAGANLGGASLREATASEPVDLTGATLWGTDLSAASLHGATVAGALVYETTLRGADLTGLKARKATFFRCDLAGARFHDADLAGCVFVECALAGADFSRARMKAATFVKAAGDGAVFRGTDAEGVRFVHGCSFAAADLQEARLLGANLRGANLRGAKLSRSNLDGADLSTCDLTGAELYESSAREARFVRADLTRAVLIGAGLLGAIMQKATLFEADLTGAILYGADMARTKGRPRSLEGANLGRVRVVGNPAHG